MWLSTHYFSGFLQDWFHVFLYEIKKNSVWYNFYQGTSVSITFYIFEHYQLWMMDSKGQRVFFPKTPQLCVWHTEVRNCYHFKLVSHFQLWFPIWGVLVNRLTKEFWISLALSREVNHTCSVLWLAVRHWCHTFMCMRSINSGSSLSWQRKLMISFMGPTKPDWSGLVLSNQNLSYNSEFVHLPSWYRPLVVFLYQQISFERASGTPVIHQICIYCTTSMLLM